MVLDYEIAIILFIKYGCKNRFHINKSFFLFDNTFKATNEYINFFEKRFRKKSMAKETTDVS